MIVIEMGGKDIESVGENVTEETFVRELYEIILTKMHRTIESGIYKSDFFYEMIKSKGHLWMDQEHPLSIMLLSNQHEPYNIMSGIFGKIVVYDEAIVERCKDTLVNLCMQYHFKINENEG